MFYATLKSKPRASSEDPSETGGVLSSEKKKKKTTSVVDKVPGLDMAFRRASRGYLAIKAISPPHHLDTKRQYSTDSERGLMLPYI